MQYGDSIGRLGLPVRLFTWIAFWGVAFAALTGCGFTGSNTAIPGPAVLRGTVRGGEQPLVGASIQLYAAGVSGNGSASQRLLGHPVRSDGRGNFSIAGSYLCPSASAQIYVVARGGNPGLSPRGENSAIALTAMLGSCGSLSSSTPIYINEVTTVGSVWPIAPYMTSPTAIGSTANDSSFLGAIASISQFVDLAQGSSPGNSTPDSYFAQNSKLYSLADVLDKCVNSKGGSAGDGSPCGVLFAIATPPNGSAPADTMTAAMRIAQSPYSKVTDIFGLIAAPFPFQPSLIAAPTDWTLTLNQFVAAPSIWPGTGNYPGPQLVTIRDATAGSTIHYTTDGTVPTPSSPLYSRALSISVSTTVKAIALAGGSQSAVSSSTLTLAAAQTPAGLSFRQQPSNGWTQVAISPAVEVVVVDANGDIVPSAANLVRLNLNGVYGLGGTLKIAARNGVATFSDLTVGTAGSYSLSATSPGLSPATSNVFTISQSSVVPAVSVAVTPGTATLTPLQTQLFTASVTGTSNTGVTWLVSPAVGSISPAGIYTAPASLLSAQTIVVTATSAADPGKSASAIITLMPAVGVSVSPGSVTLSPAQMQLFTASVTNSTNTAVMWSLSPAVGSISGAGLYTAPAVILNTQAVTVTATSAANPAKSAGATVTLSAAVGVSVSPGSVTLSPSQTQLFSSSVTNSPNAAVVWSLSPAAGSISSAGLYTAPATILNNQTVTVTATSAADPAKSAGAIITLSPAVGVSVSPGSVTLTPSQTQLFSATVTNGTNTAVVWSLSPAVGSISSGGLYTAPATVPYPGTVTVAVALASNPSATASAVVTVVPLAGTSYYLAPAGSGGNDLNDGLSPGAPWLTPNHAVNCGDVILASPGTAYSALDFASGQWGTVTCPSGNNVAWLKCATFAACKISITSGDLDGMRVSASYWGVQGWEVSNTARGSLGGSCFAAVPAVYTKSIHHIIFANNVANVCPLGGLGFGNNGAAGVDYWAAVGNIAYAAGQTNTYCGSGISAYEPVASDSLPGTHIYVAGNFSYSNTNPPGCYDGNGIIFDTFDGYQYPLPASYSQQGVIDNNIALSNGGVGVRIEYNNSGAGPGHSHLYARHNTIWNNDTGSYQYGNPTCGELVLYKTVTTEAFLNIASTDQPGCYGDPSNPAYAYSVEDIDGTSSVYQDVGWSATTSFSESTSSAGFAFGPNNIFGANPGFAAPATPAPPSCGGASSVPNCMAALTAGFTPTNSAVSNYGYQVPSTENVFDALFPQWLCNVSLPAGLVTMGCL